MNKIILITTKGCEGCSIMNRSIKEAIVQTNKPVYYETRDKKDLTNKELAKLKLNDFPTTLFYKDDKLVRKEVGSRPTIVVLRWIDIDFK